MINKMYFTLSFLHNFSRNLLLVVKMCQFSTVMWQAEPLAYFTIVKCTGIISLVSEKCDFFLGGGILI